MNLEPPPLPLSPSLHLWVLLPISIATLLMSLIRRNLAPLFAHPPPTTLLKLKRTSVLTRSTTLRKNAHQIPAPQFHARRHYLTIPKGPLDVPKKESLSSLAALMDPESLSNQVMSVILAILPNILLGTWARYMFSGIVVCRLPFTLTPKFRGMLQSGIELAGRNLDVSYVSAFSWYILNMFGNAGLIALIANRDEDVDSVFVPNVALQVAQNVAPDREFQQERQTLMKMIHCSTVHEAEEFLLQVDPAEFAAF